MTDSTSAQPDTIVLIHGLWMSPLSWEHWIDRYTQAGFHVLAPAWPGMDGTVAQLRAERRRNAVELSPDRQRLGRALRNRVLWRQFRLCRRLRQQRGGPL